MAERPNARPELRLEAGAQRTLEVISSRPGVRRGFSLDFGAGPRVVTYAWERPNASMLNSRSFTFCTLPLAVMGYSFTVST